MSEQQHLPMKYWLCIGTTHPMVQPAPALVGISDTNALASRACNAARNSVAENLFTGPAITGRSNTSANVHWLEARSLAVDFLELARLANVSL